MDACFMVDGDDLLNFTLDEGEGEKDMNPASAAAIGTSPVVSSSLGSTKSVGPDDFPVSLAPSINPFLCVCLFGGKKNSTRTSSLGLTRTSPGDSPDCLVGIGVTRRRCESTRTS